MHRSLKAGSLGYVRALATAACLMVAGGLMVPTPAHAQMEEQALVDRATLSLQQLMTTPNSADTGGLLKQSRAVMICPQVFKAGFIFGGGGGGCVLSARAGGGSWSAPAFYGMGSGSFGLQIGIQDSAIIMMVLTDKGLNALMDDQFKLGADASIAIATIGGGVEGATTAALRADIVAFSISRGLYGGITLSGSVMSNASDANQAYYGQAYAARQIVLQMQANNPGADPLREMLTRYGTQGAPGVPPRGTYAAAPPQNYPPQNYAPQQGYGAPSGQAQPTPLAPVQSQSLPPPRR